VNELTTEQKEFFKGLAERRKAKCMTRGYLSVKMDLKAMDAFLTLWDSWVAAFGLEDATDYLIEAMCEEHHLLRRRLEYKVTEQRRGEIDRRPGNRVKKNARRNR